MKRVDQIHMILCLTGEVPGPLWNRGVAERHAASWKYHLRGTTEEAPTISVMLRGPSIV